MESNLGVCGKSFCLFMTLFIINESLCHRLWFFVPSWLDYWYSIFPSEVWNGSRPEAGCVRKNVSGPHGVWSPNELLQSCTLIPTTLLTVGFNLQAKFIFSVAQWNYIQNIWISHEEISSSKGWSGGCGFLFHWASLESPLFCNAQNGTVENGLDLELKLTVRF